MMSRSRPQRYSELAISTVPMPKRVFRLTLISQTQRKVKVTSADRTYDTKLCHDELRRKKIKALIPSRTPAGYWPVEYADRNQVMARQKRTVSNP